MSKFKKVILSVFCIILLSILVACKSNNGETTTDTMSNTTFTPGPQVLSLVNKDVEIFARTNYVTSFIINSSMKEVKVVGKFKTKDGRPNIEAYIMDDTTYHAWLRGQNVNTILYDSEMKTIAFIDQEITVPGTYNLIFTNWDDPSFSTSQWVTINVDLEWVQE